MKLERHLWRITSTEHYLKRPPEVIRLLILEQWYNVATDN